MEKVGAGVCEGDALPRCEKVPKSHAHNGPSVQPNHNSPRPLRGERQFDTVLGIGPLGNPDFNFLSVSVVGNFILKFILKTILKSSAQFDLEQSTSSVRAKTPAGGEEPRIAAWRNDGLGGRINAMLNALWLAERCRVGFCFHWAPLRSEFADRTIPPPQAVFEAGFLDDCHRSQADLPVTVVNHVDLNRSSIEAAFQDRFRPGIIIRNFSSVLRLDGVPATPAELRGAWNRIGWSIRLRELEARAREAVPQRCVALHVRRGDIVYGRYKRLHWPGKFRPLAWMRRAAEILCERGEPVVVFGDSEATVDSLCAGLPVLRGSLLRPANALGFEAAFFELCALAAAEKIVGSQSAYTISAGMIGGTVPMTVEQFLPAEPLVPLALTDLAAHPERYDRFERTQTLLWLCINRPKELASGQAESLLAEASRLDPDNDLPLVILAQRRLQDGDFAAAEQLFARAAEEVFAAKGRVDPRLYGNHGGWALPGVLSALPAHERERLPYSNAYATELAGVAEPGGVRWTELALRAAAGSDLLLARHAQAVVDSGSTASAPAALAFLERRLCRPDAPVVLWTLRVSLQRLVREAAGTGSADGPAASLQDEAVRELISRLRPVPLVEELVRFGGFHDDGYLMSDDLVGISALISPGVGRQCSFDHAMAERGFPVFMADGSVASPPVPHERFFFERKFVGPCDNDTSVRLNTLVRRVPGDGDLILQMDIEGAEYHALLDASLETLRRFRVMLIEFHSLGRLLRPADSDTLFATFQRLLETHVVVHLHPNNAGTMKISGDITVPEIMEFTLLRRDRVAVDPGRTLRFPHPLDSDNVRRRPPLALPTIWHPIGR